MNTTMTNRLSVNMKTALDTITLVLTPDEANAVRVLIQWERKDQNLRSVTAKIVAAMETI